jgi:hypothetical protein
MKVAEIDHAVLAANALVVELKLLLRVEFPQLLEHLVSHLAHEQLVFTGNLQAGHQFLEGRIPHFTFLEGRLPSDHVRLCEKGWNLLESRRANFHQPGKPSAETLPWSEMKDRKPLVSP